VLVRAIPGQCLYHGSGEAGGNCVGLWRVRRRKGVAIHDSRSSRLVDDRLQVVELKLPSCPSGSAL